MAGRGGADAYESAKKAVHDIVAPAGISIMTVGADTDAHLLSDLAALWEDCGVTPVPGSVMRGALRRGIVLAALDENGKPVSAASSRKRTRE